MLAKRGQSGLETFEKTLRLVILGRKLKEHHQDLGLLDRDVHFHLLFNIVLEVLATAIRQEKEMKRHPNWKGRSKLSLFANDMTLYIENPKDSIKKLPELINELNK